MSYDLTKVKVERSLVPLGAVHQKSRTVTLPIYMNIGLSFPKDDGALLTQSDVATVLNTVDVFQPLVEKRLIVATRGRAILARATLAARDVKSIGAFSGRLLTYLFGASPQQISAEASDSPSNLTVQADEPLVDKEFDRLTPDRYSNTASLYRQTVVRRNLAILAMLRERGQSVLETERSLISHARFEKTCARVAQAIHRQMAVFESSDDVDAARSGDNDDQNDIKDPLAAYFQSFDGLRTVVNEISNAKLSKDFERFSAMLAGGPVDGNITQFAADEIYADEDTLKSRLEAGEINTLIAMALREPLVAQYLGLCTEWQAEIPRDVFASATWPLHFSVDRSAAAEPFSSENPVTVGDFIPVTVDEEDVEDIERILSGLTVGVVAPAWKMGGNTSALARLSDGSNNERYQVAQVSVDGEIIKNIDLQENNQIRKPDTVLPSPDRVAARNIDPRVYQEPDIKDPENLTNFGINQPYSAGASFHAPTEDLLNTDMDPGVLSRNDLWIGYRVDIRLDDEQSEWHSLHSETISYTFQEGRKADGDHLTHEFEDFIDREQVIASKDANGNDIAGTVLDTALLRWSGYGSSQTPPLMRVCAVDEGVSNTDRMKMPFQKSRSQVDKSAPRLFYKNRYQYRMRAVFQGGVSVTLKDTNTILNAIGDPERSTYVQSFEYFRSDPYAPGEIVDIDGTTGEADKDSAANEGDLTIYLRGDGAKRRLYLTPSALDFDQARFHNVIARDEDEFGDISKYVFTRNIRRTISEQGIKADYFRDPDVSHIRWDAMSVGRNFDTGITGTKVLDGTACDMVDHWEFAGDVVEYGRPGQWKDYTPIKIDFVATSDDRPKASQRSAFGSRIKVEIPPGDVVDLYLTPRVDAKAVMDTAMACELAACAKREGFAIAAGDPMDVMREMRAAVSPSSQSETAAVSSLRADHKSDTWLAPPFVTQRKIRVVHAVPKPPPPTIRNLQTRRFPEESSVYLEGIAHVDARTTGNVFFRTEWVDIDDNVFQPQPIYRPTVKESKPRSIVFEEKDVPDIETFENMLAGEHATPIDDVLTQCLENVVTFTVPRSGDDEPHAGDGRSETGGNVTVAGKEAMIALPDQKHHELSVSLVSVARDRAVFSDLADEDTEATSEQMTLHALCNFLPPPPQISHVVPTIERMVVVEPNGTSVTRDEFNLSFYVDRPWMLTGSGERLAIGCSTTTGSELDPDDVTKLYVTKWGEDPLERPRLDATRRLPRASDFGLVTETEGGVIYVDNLTLEIPRGPEPDAGTEAIVLGLASYAMTYDAGDQLWHAQVRVIPDFFGWLRIAVFRHQHYSEAGFHISTEPVYVYVAKLQDEIVTRFDRAVQTEIAVGPIADRTISYRLVPVTEIASGVMTEGDAVGNESDISANGMRVQIFRVPKGDQKYALQRLRAGHVQTVVAVI